MSRLDQLLHDAAKTDLTDFPKLSTAEQGRILALIGQKMDGHPPVKPMRGGRKLLLVAAIFVAGCLLVAAAIYGVDDLFRPVLNEQNADGEIVPLSAHKELVHQAGVLINQTQLSGDTAVTLQGMVGDDNSFMFLVEVADVNGNPLIGEELMERNADYSQMVFNRVSLYVDLPQHEGAPEANLQYIAGERIDDAGDPSKATYLYRDVSWYEGITGHRATVTLRELRVPVRNVEPVPIAFSNEDLAAVYGLLPEVQDDEVYRWYHFFDEEEVKQAMFPESFNRDDQGYYLESYLPDSGQRIPFTPDYPSASIINMGFVDGQFHVAVEYREPEDQVLYRRGLSLFDPSDGRLYTLDSSSSTGTGYEAGLSTYENFGVTPPAYLDDGHGLIYFIFNGITSPVQLTGLLPHEKTTSFFETVDDSVWSFEFDLDFADTSVVHQTDTSFTYVDERLGELKLDAREVVISPFALTIKGEHNYPHSMNGGIDIPMELQYRSGASGNVSNNTITLRSVDWDDGSFALQYILPVVIDPDEVVGVMLDDMLIDL